MEAAERDRLTGKIIGCALEVHRQLGPGLLESTYESALCVEFEMAGLAFQRQPIFPVVYKGRAIGEYRLDLVVENSVIVEIKSVERLDPVFGAQVLTYLKATGKNRSLNKFQFTAIKRRSQKICLINFSTLCLCGSVANSCGENRNHGAINLQP